MTLEIKTGWEIHLENVNFEELGKNRKRKWVSVESLLKVIEQEKKSWNGNFEFKRGTHEALNCLTYAIKKEFKGELK